MSLASAARADPLILQPGDSLDNIVLEEVLINEETSAGSGDLTLANVRRGAVGDNKVQLNAVAQTCGIPNRLDGSCSVLGRTTAFARAELFIEFCVPEAGAASCGGVPSGAAEDVTTTVSLDILRIGQFLTQVTGTAGFKITVRVRDLERKRTVGFQQIENISQGGGIPDFVTILKVPIPTPEFDDEEIADKTVFTVQVRRGHVHRFSVFAAARADSGRRGTVIINFNDILAPVITGRVEAQNLSIDVSPGAIDPTSENEARIAALEEHLANLGLQVNALAEIQSELLGGLRQDVSDLTIELDDLVLATDEIQGQLDVLTFNFNAHSHDCVLKKPGRAKRSHKDDDDDDNDKDRGRDRPKWVIACGPSTR